MIHIHSQELEEKFNEDKYNYIRDLLTRINYRYIEFKGFFYFKLYITGYTTIVTIMKQPIILFNILYNQRFELYMVIKSNLINDFNKFIYKIKNLKIYKNISCFYYFIFH